MTPQLWFVLAVLTATVVLFASGRFRLDLIALTALLTLLLSGILTPGEALAGFADPVVLMIAGLFVVGGAIFESGLADAAGRWLGRVAGVQPTRLLIVVMVATALLSALLSSTGTVAVMLPVVVSLVRRAGLNPSKVLLPLAFASLLGGMLTLIGTPPNLVVSNQLRAEGFAPFNFFAFTPVGLVVLAIGILFMVTLGQRLLPDRRPPAADEGPRVTREQLIDAYALRERLFELQLLPTSEGVGRTLAELGLRTRYGIDILTLSTPTARGPHLRRADPSSLLRAGDTLLVKGERQAVERFATKQDVLITRWRAALPEALHLAEVLVPPRSSLLGQSVRDVRFRDRYGVAVLADKRGGELLEVHTSTAPLRLGDTLLVAGDRAALERLNRHHDFIVVGEPGELSDRALSPRAPWVLAILLGMLTLMTFGVTANVAAVLLAAVAVVAVGALGMDDAYRHINWESVVLIAAILPVATALEKTGGLDLIVSGLLGGLGGSSPTLVLLILFALTSVLSQVISNTATTVLVAPVAFGLALDLGLSPYPLLMTVAVAASTAFLTPVASPVNALVINPGNYRFGDFLRVGAPLQLLVLAVTLLVVPWVFPF